MGEFIVHKYTVYTFDEEDNSWTFESELELLDLLEALHEKGKRFILLGDRIANKNAIRNIEIYKGEI